ncbi:hypothetical protein GPB2148_3198 [marine gamma proteobacterium HTCC2148]|nr:hypothetical protein GPB2148_3198 [marine gamma proteobacterium HTCC2148]
MALLVAVSLELLLRIIKTLGFRELPRPFALIGQCAPLITSRRNAAMLISICASEALLG